jgi:hypothetical protein
MNERESSKSVEVARLQMKEVDHQLSEDMKSGEAQPFVIHRRDGPVCSCVRLCFVAFGGA